MNALISASLLTSSGAKNLAFGLGVGQLRYAPAVALPFVVGPIGQMRKSALPPFGQNLLGDRPGDRMLVGHP